MMADEMESSKDVLPRMRSHQELGRRQGGRTSRNFQSGGSTRLMWLSAAAPQTKTVFPSPQCLLRANSRASSLGQVYKDDARARRAASVILNMQHTVLPASSAMPEASKLNERRPTGWRNEDAPHRGVPRPSPCNVLIASKGH